MLLHLFTGHHRHFGFHFLRALLFVQLVVKPIRAGFLRQAQVVRFSPQASVSCGCSP